MNIPILRATQPEPKFVDFSGCFAAPSEDLVQAQIDKTDRNDARGIAQMMRVGLYPNREGDWVNGNCALRF